MFRSKLPLFVLLFSLSGALIAFAQGGSRSQSGQVELQVHVTYSNGKPAGQQLRVSLEDASGIPTMEQFTNDSGEAHFRLSGGGSFRVKVSGMGIKDAVSEQVMVTTEDRFKPVYVQVHPTSDPELKSKPGNGAITSASNLKIPPAAQKSFDRGLEAFQQKDYKKAAELFQKATVTYPQYDGAFDNLGVALMNLGRVSEARIAFQHAVKLNDKNADADRNYSRLLISDEQYVAAKELLQKALGVEPQEPASLVLLAIAQLKTSDFDGALRTALAVHHLAHEGYAVAHYVAGRVFEIKHELQNASTEYQMYLRESPDGPEAGQVRAGLARVRAGAQTESQ